MAEQTKNTANTTESKMQKLVEQAWAASGEKETVKRQTAVNDLASLVLKGVAPEKWEETLNSVLQKTELPDGDASNKRSNLDIQGKMADAIQWAEADRAFDARMTDVDTYKKLTDLEKTYSADNTDELALGRALIDYLLAANKSAGYQGRGLWEGETASFALSRIGDSLGIVQSIEKGNYLSALSNGIGLVRQVDQKFGVPTINDSGLVKTDPVSGEVIKEPFLGKNIDNGLGLTKDVIDLTQAIKNDNGLLGIINPVRSITKDLDKILPFTPEERGYINYSRLQEKT